jgi:hypothetical protein
MSPLPVHVGSTVREEQHAKVSPHPHHTKDSCGGERGQPTRAAAAALFSASSSGMRCLAAIDASSTALASASRLARCPASSLAAFLPSSTSVSFLCTFNIDFSQLAYGLASMTSQVELCNIQQHPHNALM